MSVRVKGTPLQPSAHHEKSRAIPRVQINIINNLKFNHYGNSS